MNIMGTVVPTGQTVPSAGEVARMEVHYCPFDTRIFMDNDLPERQLIMRRLLWAACREALQREDITHDALGTLISSVMSIRRGLSATDREEEDAAAAALQRQTLRHQRETEVGQHAISDPEPVTFRVSATRLSSRAASGTSGRAATEWPSIERVMGERVDPNARQPRNVQIREPAPEVGGGGSLPEADGEVE